MEYPQKKRLTRPNKDILSVPLHPLFKTIYGKTDRRGQDIIQDKQAFPEGNSRLRPY